LILKTEKNLWPSAQAENCRVALGLKRLDTPELEYRPTASIYSNTKIHYSMSTFSTRSIWLQNVANYKYIIKLNIIK